MASEEQIQYSTEDVFVCKVCQQAFKQQSALVRHETRHNLPGGFLCRHCDPARPFTTEAARLEHVEKEHKFYRCEACESIFEHDSHLREHVRLVHGGSNAPIHTCPLCLREFRSGAQYGIHQNTKCGTVKNFACGVCGSRYLTQNSLKQHQLSHAPEKMHLCGYCGRNFLSKGQLKVHERCHTKERPFACSEPNCGKSFAHRESLVTHLTVHTGIKPYVCSFCSNRFSCIGNLLKHRKSRPDSCGLPQYAEVNRIGPKIRVKTTRAPAVKLEKKIVPMIRRGPYKKKVKEEPPSEPIIIAQPAEVSPQPQYYQIAFAAPSESVVEEKTICSPLQYTTNLTVSYVETPIVQYEAQNVVFIENWTPDNINVSQEVVKSEIITEEEAPIEYEMIEESPASDVDDMIAPDPPSPPKSPPASDSPPTPLEEDENEVKFRAAVTISGDSFECKLCPKIYESKGMCIRHLAEHGVHLTVPRRKNKDRRRSSNARFKCRFCHRGYCSRVPLEKHEKLHGEDGSLRHKCSVCSLFFATPDAAEEHQKTAHSDRLTCTPCQRAFRDPECLAAHIRYQHRRPDAAPRPREKKTFVCDRCGRSFCSKIALNDHERSDCGQRPRYECDVCHRHYHSAGSLKTHKGVHSGELPFECGNCGKRYRTAGQVKIHSRIHTDEKPFECKICGRAFKHRETLLTHQSVHGFKRFVCAGCSSRFSCISNLQAHRRSHKECAALPLITKPVGPEGIIIRQLVTRESEVLEEPVGRLDEVILSGNVE